MGLSDHPVAKVPLKELHGFNRAQTFIRPIVVPCGPGSLLVSLGAFEPKKELVGLTVVGHGLSCRLAFKVGGGEDLFQVPMAREGVFSDTHQEEEGQHQASQASPQHCIIRASFRA